MTHTKFTNDLVFINRGNSYLADAVVEIGLVDMLDRAKFLVMKSIAECLLFPVCRSLNYCSVYFFCPFSLLDKGVAARLISHLAYFHFEIFQTNLKDNLG